MSTGEVLMQVHVDFSTCYNKKAQGEQKSVSEFVSALKFCSKRRDLEGGKELHREAVAAGYNAHNHLSSLLITLYSRCRSMPLARQVFDGMTHKDVVTWTSLISGYVENGESSVAINLFTSMDCEPDHVTYVAALRACASLASMKESQKPMFLERGVNIHRQLKNRGFDCNIVVGNILVDMYGKCGDMKCAREVFDGMIRKDVITWSSLILGYVENGNSSVAMELFTEMDCEPNHVTYIAALRACAGLAGENGTEKQRFLKKGITIHKQLKACRLDSETAVANTLLHMYCKCGSMQCAQEVFEEIAQKSNVVTWNCLMLGYVENGKSSVALDLFITMDCEPSHATYVALLKACRNLAVLPIGRLVHGKICELGLEQDEVLATILVDFYGKCHSLTTAEELFNSLHSPNLITWTTLIAGYSLVGNSCHVFSLHKKMEEAGLQMDGAAHTCILMGCSHSGMVEEGKEYFESMCRSGIRPTLEHYTCLVGMLGRANRLEEALSIIKRMPFKADKVTWTTLLEACRKWKNLDVAKVAYDALMTTDTKDRAAYVLMSDIYGS